MKDEVPDWGLSHKKQVKDLNEKVLAGYYRLNQYTQCDPSSPEIHY